MKKLILCFVISLTVFCSEKIKAQAPFNDEPCSTIALTVGTTCNYTQYTTANATASAGVPAPGCASYNGGDVWFSAVVPLSGSIIFDTNTGVITDGGMALYTGSCNSLTQIACDDDGSANGLMPSIYQTGLNPGTTLYIRFWEYGNDNNGTFSICAREIGSCNSVSNHTCSDADPICTGVSYDFCNTTNTPSLGGGGIYGCCLSTPNPSFYYMNVAVGGAINFNISQQTYGGVPIDVDYVLWGPFTSQVSICDSISAGKIVDCSYSTSSVEAVAIPNALAGQWYMILTTNYSNQPGIINYYQTNSDSSNAGVTDCNIVTATPGSCSGGLFNLTGTITVTNPPSTGTLTVSNSCGGSQVLSAPFSNVMNYSIPNICGLGNACSVTATFSASGAPTILPATYTSPSCNILTVTPGACSGGYYVLSGTLSTGCAPSTGTLTITSSCGGSVVYNAPFSNPLNWWLPSSNGNGGACTVTAVYSAAGAPSISPIVFNEPTCCLADAGTITSTVTNGTQTLLANGSTQIILCPSGSVNLVSNNDYVLPPAGCTSCSPELFYAIYNSDGPSSNEPALDSNWTGYYWTGQDFITSTGGGYNVNSSGGCSPLLTLPNVGAPYASPNSTNNTLVFVPITADDGDNDIPGVSIGYDQNGDGCYDLGNPISITFLNPITFNPTQSCNGTVSIEITGGYPEFFPSNYSLTNTGAGSLASTVVSSGGNAIVNGLHGGDTYSFSVNDGSGCTQTFSGIFSKQPVVSVSPVTTEFCSSGSCVNLISSVVDAAESTYSNNHCENIVDAGIGANCNTGPFNCAGSWSSSIISISDFCGTTWHTNDELIVCLNIKHTSDADLNIILQSPNGALVKLSDDNGGTSDNYTNTCFSMAAATSIAAGTAPFTGTFKPEGNFSALNGTNVNGNWTLWVADDLAQDIGSLLNWSLTFANPSNTTYSWSPSTGLSATNILNPTACPTTSTTYTLTVTNSCGCSSSATASVLVGCLMPTNISVNNVGTTSATVSWTGNSCAVKYRVQYRKQGTTAWTTKTVTAPTVTKTLTGLTELTTYEYKVRTDCDASGATHSAFSSVQTFTTPCTCSKPTNILVTGLTQTSATVNWTGNACAYQYRLQYRKQGTTAWTTKLVLAPSQSKILTGLTANLIYEYKIRTDCNSGGTVNSGYTTVQTFTTPLKLEQENFSAQIKIFPNPTDKSFYINSSVAIENIECYNSIGQLVLIRNFESEIDMKEYPAGNYLLKLNFEKGEGYKIFKVMVVR